MVLGEYLTFSNYMEFGRLCFKKLVFIINAKIAFFEILFSDFFENEGNKLEMIILSSLLARIESLF